MEDNFKEIVEEAVGKDLDELEYSDRLQNFIRKFCEACGSQRCLGVYDREWREGCEFYKKEFCE